MGKFGLTSLAMVQYGHVDFEKITTLSFAIEVFTNSAAIAIFAGFRRAKLIILPIKNEMYKM